MILGKDWQPLQPTEVKRKGKIITIHYHVPVPPLVWETRFEAPHPYGRGVEAGKGVRGDHVVAGVKVAIVSAAISGDAVVITCASDPDPGARVGYALLGEKNRMAAPFPGTFRWGLLRDSDPFQGTAAGMMQPNYGVAFEMPVP